MSNPMFPEKLFRKPLKSQVTNSDGTVSTKAIWHFGEDPLQKRLTEMEVMNSEALRRARSTDLTQELVKSLYLKATRVPSENINIEIKGETRSGKSTTGISLGKLISSWWGYEFTVDNILPNQGELLYKLKDAKYGETFVVDEQTPETYGEGILRETEQLGMNLNICAKKCNNLIFIYPPSFTSRNSPFGLEAISKDVQNKYIKCLYYDLRRKDIGGGQVPRGYITIPKYVDETYRCLPKEKQSKYRVDNILKHHFDFDSLLEEQYEQKKDSWIDDVRNMDASVRSRHKQELATTLAEDLTFQTLKSNGHREAYIQLMINTGDIIEMAKTEINSVSNMAQVIILKNGWMD